VVDCDDSCDNRNGRGINPESPRDLASELDNGAMLEQLWMHCSAMPTPCSPRQFEQTVRQLGSN
jgi:hypothetical protein